MFQFLATFVPRQMDFVVASLCQSCSFAARSYCAVVAGGLCGMIEGGKMEETNKVERK
jgi:hypothetical protein